MKAHPQHAHEEVIGVPKLKTPDGSITDFAGSSGDATTTWDYDDYRGWLSAKRYADAGRLKTRQWARTGTGGQRILTTYKYGFDDGIPANEHEDLVSVEYGNDPASTANVTHNYDRRGRQLTVSQGTMATAFQYNDANQPTSETIDYDSNPLDGWKVVHGYNTSLRRSQAQYWRNTSLQIQHESGGWFPRPRRRNGPVLSIAAIGPHRAVSSKPHAPGWWAEGCGPVFHWPSCAPPIGEARDKRAEAVVPQLADHPAQWPRECG